LDVQKFPKIFLKIFDIHGLEGLTLADFPFSHQSFPLPAGGKAG
jgi:hypothetical protein